MSNYKILTPTQKQEIIDLWELGDATLKDIAVKFERSQSTISKVISDSGAVKGVKRAVSPEVIGNTIKQAELEQSVIDAQHAQETKKDSYTLARYLQKIIGRELKNNDENKKSNALSHDTFKSILLAAQAIRTTQQIRERACGLDQDKPETDKPLPTLGVHLVSDKQVKEIQEANRVTNEFDDMEEKLLKELSGGKGKTK